MESVTHIQPPGKPCYWGSKFSQFWLRGASLESDGTVGEQTCIHFAMLGAISFPVHLHTSPLHFKKSKPMKCNHN